ncbi:hypothetical protein ACWM6E_07095, partial [Cupriavidus necator]
MKFGRPMTILISLRQSRRCALRVSVCLPAAWQVDGSALPLRLLAASKEDTTMSDLFFGTDLFSELDRMQRQMASLFGG